jgi:hypothetical protein
MMKTMTKQKRDRLLLVAFGTAALCAGVWFSLVTTQKRALVDLARLTEEQQSRLNSAGRIIDGASHVANRFDAVSHRLGLCEETMASTDLYSWLIMTVNQFKAPYRVDIPQFSREVPCEVGMFPKFPYQAALFNVAGTAYYHDLGRFITDLENAYPFVSVRNLEVDTAPASAGNTEDCEKLSFRMEIVTLVNPHVN